ncbi:MAG TPA: hypothetical protein VFI39_05815 [Gemmatimonadales bacterium]|nr:hypothetical protein [Gemmatimonadales bacterium]
MKTNRLLAAALGFLSVFPLAAVPLFLYVLFPQAEASPTPITSSFMIDSVLLVIAAFLAMAIFIAFVWRSRRVPRADKRLWSLLIIVGSLFTMPVFWFLYIWKERPLEERPTLESFVSGAT